MNVNVPKGPWTKCMNNFPKDFSECSLFSYSKLIDSGNEKLHLTGYKMFRCSKVKSVFVHYGSDEIIVKANIDASMKRLSYKALIFLKKNGEVKNAHCTCIAGKSGYCKHIFALLWQILEGKRDCQAGVNAFLDENVPSTSKERAWGCGNELLSEEKPLKDFKFIKYDPRKLNKRSEKDYEKRLHRLETFKIPINADLLKSQSDLLRNCSLSFFSEVLKENEYEPVLLTTEVCSHDQNSIFNLPTTIKWKDNFLDIIKEENSYNYAELLNSCSLTLNEAQSIEKKTKTQSASQIWKRERMTRITSSKFGSIIKRKAPVNEKFLSHIWPKREIITAAMKAGLDNENVAAAKYEKENEGFRCFPCGLVIVNPGIPFLATSPDRVIFDISTNSYHLLEIKTLVSGGLTEKLTVKQCVEQGYAPFLENNNEVLSLKKTHNYFFQIQGQLALTGLLRCDLLVDSGEDIFIQTIPFFENDWVLDHLPVLTRFYFKYYKTNIG